VVGDAPAEGAGAVGVVQIEHRASAWTKGRVSQPGRTPIRGSRRFEQCPGHTRHAHTGGTGIETQSTAHDAALIRLGRAMH
jgi:hypothetical protein